MQGGGSLGAYECGVYKALSKRDIKFDIVAGTSIGAVNAAIVAGSKNDNPEGDLEDFWLDVAERVTGSIISDNLRAVMSSWYAALYGNAKIFSPAWYTTPSLNYTPLGHFTSIRPPYMYDLAILKRTLERYVDFSKLNSNNVPRLIVTATDIKNSKAVLFDSMATNIDADHILACASYPFYGIGWTEKDGKFLWDGALLSNTPLREVIEASPKRDKKVYIVNLFPHVQEELPENMFDIWHRARDIMHTDKTDSNVRLSKAISGYLLLLREMHDILSNAPLDKELHERFTKIEPEYHKLADARGAIIDEITKIERREKVHFLFEDADFSLATIKNLIKQGEEDAEKVIVEKEKGKADDRN
ncbi:putative esterase of the alpha-beta hydrolase superfamily [Candidatus Nitrososphaera evergladensis SR1]|uniref:Putative esterase of the alpha-beta hydrolase superfamily n=2 Tax=Nitrososphaera TaxID=497726 RepID=A0A075MXW9_9ARCH|nr:putative esterase of the alpha-beta hydrolase superfamily [Candidatus Nitrososphaera evergladensis SR1]